MKHFLTAFLFSIYSISSVGLYSADMPLSEERTSPDYTQLVIASLLTEMRTGGEFSGAQHRAAQRLTHLSRSMPEAFIPSIPTLINIMYEDNMTDQSYSPGEEATRCLVMLMKSGKDSVVSVIAAQIPRIEEEARIGDGRGDRAAEFLGILGK